MVLRYWTLEIRGGVGRILYGGIVPNAILLCGEIFFSYFSPSLINFDLITRVRFTCFVDIRLLIFIFIIRICLSNFEASIYIFTFIGERSIFCVLYFLYLVYVYVLNFTSYAPHATSHVPRSSFYILCSNSVSHILLFLTDILYSSSWWKWTCIVHKKKTRYKI